jgi:hypothetical protein
MEFDPKAAYRVALAGERANTERICRALATGEMSLNQMGPAVGATGGPGDRLAMIYMGISLNESRAAMLRAISKASAAIDLPGTERMSRLEEIDQEFNHAPPIARLFGPAMAKYHHAYARSEAKHQCSIAALAAERFRRESGRWPKDLEELTPKFLPETPLDPFNDQPLGYRPTRDGVVLYSVGPEGKYGGTYRDGKQDRQDAATYDPSASSYEFRLWNVPLRRQVARAAR